MTISPYDSLTAAGSDVHNNDDVKSTLQAGIPTETEPEAVPEPEATTTPEAVTEQPEHEAVPEPHYVDVEIEEANPDELGISGCPQVLIDHTRNSYHRQRSGISPAPGSPPVTTPMTSQPQYTSLSIKNRRGASEYILPFEESLLVPDTMPDMGEILFAEAAVRTQQSAGNSYSSDDFISGEITFYTVYRPEAPEDCPVDVVKSTIPFRTDKCWSSEEGSTFRASVFVRKIKAVKTNERKFTATGELVFKTTEIAQQELTVFQSSSDPELVCLRDSVPASELIFETEESTEISQEINIREGEPQAVRILKETFEVIENHKQVTSGKLVINAAISSHILYIGEDSGEQKLCSMNSKTDFTQFVPLKENLDVSMISTDYNCSELYMTIESDEEFKLQGQVRTIIRGYSDTQVPVVSDAYHKTREISFRLTEHPLSSISATVSGEISAREVISIDDTSKRPERLVCGSSGFLDVKGRTEGGRIIIEGSVPVTILALDEGNIPFAVTSMVPLRGSLELPASADAGSVEVNACVKEFWFDEINSRQIEVNISAAISVWICCRNTFATMSELAFTESGAPVKRTPLAVYVTGQGDTLWSIAKRYRSDIDTIAELNQADRSKPLPEGMKLLIMK